MRNDNLTGLEVATLLGVTRETVRLWAKAGCPRGNDGKYSLPQVFRWRLARDEEGATPRPESKDQAHWALIFRKEKALAARIERRTVEGKLVPLAAVDQQWSLRVAEVCGGLSALASRLPPLLEGKDQIEMAELIRAEIRALRDTYSRGGKYSQPTASAQAG